MSKRQLICFGAGAAIGVLLFFLLKGSIGTSSAVICMIIVMLPFFLLAMYEKNGQPLEKILWNIIQVYFSEAEAAFYQTNNFYPA
ncbi:PrgI family protein [Mesotoga sp.]|uniref:PrgI family protein n=1 Tax=Mesotoga sp. TaxID=2053577 RepID=UPI00345E362D